MVEELEWDSLRNSLLFEKRRDFRWGWHRTATSSPLAFATEANNGPLKGILLTRCPDCFIGAFQ